MIYSLFGEVKKISVDYLVLNVVGVGYKVFMPTNDLTQINLNDVKNIFTYFYINSNYETYLFGFLEESNLELFKLLVSVSGVGPKTGLNVLSVLSKEEIINGIKNSDSNLFTKVKGLGKKTGLKIIVELSNKFGSLDNINLPSFNSGDIEIVESLAAMGYEKSKIERVLSSIEHSLSEDAKVKKILAELKKW